jgi:uncharacterized protein
MGNRVGGPSQAGTDSPIYELRPSSGGASTGSSAARSSRRLTAQPRQGSPGTGRPVTAFLILAFAIAYPVMTLVALAVHRVIPSGSLLDQLPVPPDEIAGLILTVLALLPSALFVTWAASGRPGLISLIKRIVRWRFGIGWWLAVLASLPVLTVIFTLILGGSLESIEPVGLFWNPLRLLLINFILVCLPQ